MTALAMSRPSLARLTGVELRKMVDTRAGFWLLTSIALLTIAVVVGLQFTADHDDSLRGNLVDSLQVALALLPVVGILLVTSEWTQRTSLITFALVPRRARVVTAKLAAGVALSVVGWVVVLAIAAVGTAFAGGDWLLPGWLIGQSTLYLAAAMVMGIAFGAAFLSSAPAIVVYFVVPIAFNLLGAIPALDGLATWLDGTQTLEPLVNEQMSGADWAHAGTTLAVWVALPLVVGFWRITRSDVA
jgi:ABC-type transport system involved in multi-copper enzyme maturation permease subunit